MRRINQFFRFFYIQYVMARHGVERVVFQVEALHGWRFLSYLNPWNWFRHEEEDAAVSVRQALESLGPIFVKFGQILSTRPDMIPDDIIAELSKLQDKVPPYPGEIAKKIVEKAYGKPVDEVFEEFCLEPLASASIAQVHPARLRGGQKVVVKVLRPNIQKIIKRDVGLMYFVASLAERFWSQAYRLRPREVVEEFEQTITDELDMMREAANASQLRRNFDGSPHLYVPEVYWEYTRSNVLVLERIEGIPCTDLEELRRRHFDLKKIGEMGVEIFFTQVFRDSFFHADMHPGNIFISKDDPDNPKYMAVDFGIMGTLDPTDQRYLAENLLAFFRRDYRQVAVLHVESGWVPPETRIDSFESAIRCVCEPIFERPLSEISFGRLLLRLFQVAGRFNMQVQPQLLLLQKTLLSVEGLGRQLYPELDLWANAKPFLENWMNDKIGIKALAKNVTEKAPHWAEKFTDVPDLFYHALQEHLLMMRLGAKPVQPFVKSRPRMAKRLLFVGGVALIAAALVNLFFLHSDLELRYATEVGVAGMGGLLLVISAFMSPRSS